MALEKQLHWKPLNQNNICQRWVKMVLQFPTQPNSWPPAMVGQNVQQWLKLGKHNGLWKQVNTWLMHLSLAIYPQLQKHLQRMQSMAIAKCCTGSMHYWRIPQIWNCRSWSATGQQQQDTVTSNCPWWCAKSECSYGSNVPCKTERCGCKTANLPCTILCVCHGDKHCGNELTHNCAIEEYDD